MQPQRHAASNCGNQPEDQHPDCVDGSPWGGCWTYHSSPPNVWWPEAGICWDMLGYAGMAVGGELRAMFYIVFLMLFDVICLIRSWIVYIRSLIIWWAIWFLHDICPKHRFLGHENDKFLPGSAAGDVNFVARGRAFLWQICGATVGPVSAVGADTGYIEKQPNLSLSLYLSLIYLCVCVYVCIYIYTDGTLGSPIDDRCWWSNMWKMCVSP